VPWDISPGPLEVDPPRRSKASLFTSSRIPKREVLNTPWEAVVRSVLEVRVVMVNANTPGAASIAAIAMLSFIVQSEINFNYCA